MNELMAVIYLTDDQLQDLEDLADKNNTCIESMIQELIDDGLN